MPIDPTGQVNLTGNYNIKNNNINNSEEMNMPISIFNRNGVYLYSEPAQVLQDYPVEEETEEDKLCSVSEFYSELDVAKQQVDNKRAQINIILNGTGSNEQLNQEQRVFNKWYDTMLVSLDEEADNIPDEQLEEYETLQDALLQNIESSNLVFTLTSDVMDIKDEIASVMEEIDKEKLELKKLELRYSSMPQDRNEDREQFPKDSTMRTQLKLSRKDVERDIKNKNASIDGLETRMNELKSLLSDKMFELNTAEMNYKPELLAQERDEIISHLKPFMAEENTKIAMFAVNRHLNTLNDIKSGMLEGMLDELNSREKYADLKRYEFDKAEFNYDTEKEKLFKERFSQKLNKLHPDSVFLPRIDFIIDTANKYEIEPELLAAIMCKESLWGDDETCVDENRFGGVKGGDGDFNSYSDVEEGIEAVAKNLASYVERFDSVDEISIYELKDIGAIWCPGSEAWLRQTEEIYCSLKWG